MGKEARGEALPLELKEAVMEMALISGVLELLWLMLPAGELLMLPLLLPPPAAGPPPPPAEELGLPLLLG